MTASTPHVSEHEALASLASRYVNVADLPWLPTRFKGVELKILMEDQATGLLTALTRFQPGAVLPDHEHVELEQTFVLEGELEDEEGIASASIIGLRLFVRADDPASAASPLEGELVFIGATVPEIDLVGVLLVERSLQLGGLREVACHQRKRRRLTRPYEVDDAKEQCESDEDGPCANRLFYSGPVIVPIVVVVSHESLHPCWRPRRRQGGKLCS